MQAITTSIPAPTMPPAIISEIRPKCSTYILSNIFNIWARNVRRGHYGHYIQLNAFRLSPTAVKVQKKVCENFYIFSMLH